MKKVTKKMRKPLKLLWESILDKNNEDRLFDMMSLFALVINKSVTNEELEELKEYINVKYV